MMKYKPCISTISRENNSGLKEAFKMIKSQNKTDITARNPTEALLRGDAADLGRRLFWATAIGMTFLTGVILMLQQTVALWVSRFGVVRTERVEIIQTDPILQRQLDTLTLRMKTAEERADRAERRTSSVDVSRQQGDAGLTVRITALKRELDELKAKPAPTQADSDRIVYLQDEIYFLQGYHGSSAWSVSADGDMFRAFRYGAFATLAGAVLLSLVLFIFAAYFHLLR